MRRDAGEGAFRPGSVARVAVEASQFGQHLEELRIGETSATSQLHAWVSAQQAEANTEEGALPPSSECCQERLDVRMTRRLRISQCEPGLLDDFDRIDRQDSDRGALCAP